MCDSATCHFLIAVLPAGAGPGEPADVEVLRIVDSRRSALLRALEAAEYSYRHSRRVNATARLRGRDSLDSMSTRFLPHPLDAVSADHKRKHLVADALVRRFRCANPSSLAVG